MRLTSWHVIGLAAAALLGQTGAVTADAGSAGVESVLGALDRHLATHPRAEARDVYKFLFQGVLGPGHAIPSPEAAMDYLESEVASLAPSVASAPLCEPLGGRPAMVRVHLRPFAAEGHALEQLVAAFVDSAAEVVIDRERFDRVLAMAAVHLEECGRQELASDLRRLAEEMRGQGLPALHHGQAYRRAYAPAYRVVLATEASSRGWCPTSVPSP